MASLWAVALMSAWAVTAGPQVEDTLIEVPPAEWLDLATTYGDVHIMGWEDDRVEIRTQQHPGIRVEVKHTAERVEIRVHREPRQALRQVDLEIRMPSGMGIYALGEESRMTVRGFRSSVELWVEHGDVEATDIHGKLLINATTGNIRLAKVSGTLDLSATAGRITVDGVEGDLEAETVGGDIFVKRSRARQVRLTSNHGTLNYQGDLVEGGLYDLATQSGEVDFRIPAGKGARYEIGTVRGRLESNLPFPTGQPGERVTLTVGGAKAEVKIITFRGDIRVFESP